MSTAEPRLNGVILLDKDSGMASNQALGKIKHLLRPWLPAGGRRAGGVKFGFLGTLDPLATGVLPVFVGKATRLIHLFQGLDKAYLVTVRLGERTDTYDSEGQVVETRPIDGLQAGQVQAVVEGFSGETAQTVPAYSAVKVGGVPAYRMARAGEAVPERVRQVRLWDLAVQSLELPEVVFRVHCTAGTYMRALADDIGQALGVGGHVTALRRLSAGPLFPLENSFTIERISCAVEQGNLDFILNPAQFLPGHRPFQVEAGQAALIRDGRTIQLHDTASRPPGTQPALRIGEPAKALGPDGGLMAVGEIVDMQGNAAVFQPTRVLI